MARIRQYLVTVACALATLIVFQQPAQAEYPEKPVQIIVPFAAGDAIDGTARVLAKQLERQMGAPFIVRNVPGGGGSQGFAVAHQADADGYTLLMASTGAMTARPLISDTGYKPGDFVTIAQLVEVPIALAVPARSPFHSIEDIVNAARKQPGSIKYSTPGPGSTQHINMEIFANRHHIKLTHIGGRGGKGAVIKALSGEVDFAFVGAANYPSLVKAGKLRVLGVAAAEPPPYLPDAPTFQKQGYDFIAAVWFGLVTNHEVPQGRVEKLRDAVDTIAQADATRQLYHKFHLTPAYLDGQAFQQRIDGDMDKHAQALKAIGLLK